MPYDLTLHFPKGNYPGPDYKHGVVTFSDHPRIPNGIRVEYHRDHANGGEDVLRVHNGEEYRVALEDGYEVKEGGGGSSMKCTVLDDEPWRVTHTRQAPGGDA
ncbi:hypothetical protein HNR42_001900 [Deinobacterium chartae]|uniref:Uncharacterized protein n=1 Tax=Deinobacterium chartae TaxID=521158 RepID=A0A841I027_9DEIO|nr:HK97 gp10 family phage protein [Deinobacterium chartae]MBB6098466.1 hypothetical protein [Deinobacterium chartae]